MLLMAKVDLVMVKSKLEVVKSIQEVVRARYCQEWGKGLEANRHLSRTGQG